MDLDKEKIVTQDDLNEPAPSEIVEERVQAEMKKIEGEAKKKVGDAMQNPKLAREGENLKEQGERELEDAKNSGS
jgi:uncharacterized protein YjbJ (UPF0337 family)